VRTPRGRRVAWLGAVALLALLAVPAPAGAVPAKINGSGSTYVGLAMQQWVADAQTRGLDINYLPTGSPQGLTSFSQGLIDFAGTEAEFSSLGAPSSRSFQYVPDVAGAVSVMYNAYDKAGRKVDYLHLSMRTIARIFLGDITKWSDPAISADNKGLELPDEPITVVYRSGQSGTTALFYDFVSHVAPEIFGPWAARLRINPDVRIIQLDGTPDFAPKTLALNGSDQIAQYVAGDTGRWSIAYDEFGYAKTYNATAAWVQNASGNWVLPYAENIAAALESAQLRPDLSQELSGVYTSQNPETYPISAYSYIVTQCAPDGARPSCGRPYADAGVAETLSKWMRYIACDGQVNMARIGYSPLPSNLSQELVNSIGRMQGTAAEALTPDNCSNPTFHGSLGAGAASPKDPLADVGSLGSGPGGGAASGGGGETASAGGGGGGASGSDAASTESAAAAGSSQSARSAAQSGRAQSGGSDTWRGAAPVAAVRAESSSSGAWPVIALAVAICLPVIVGTIADNGRRRRKPDSAA